MDKLWGFLKELVPAVRWRDLFGATALMCALAAALTWQTSALLT